VRGLEFPGGTGGKRDDWGPAWRCEKPISGDKKFPRNIAEKDQREAVPDMDLNSGRPKVEVRRAEKGSRRLKLTWVKVPWYERC